MFKTWFFQTRSQRAIEDIDAAGVDPDQANDDGDGGDDDWLNDSDNENAGQQGAQNLDPEERAEQVATQTLISRLAIKLCIYCSSQCLCTQYIFLLWLVDVTTEPKNFVKEGNWAQQSRKAFNALRSQYGSTYKFCRALFKEKNLQCRMRMLIDGCEELHAEYINHLESQKKGISSMVKWAGDRANGKWYGTIVQMSAKLQGPDRIERLRLSTTSDSSVVDFDPENPVLKNEAMLLSEYGNLVLSFLSNRAWSQCHFGAVFPYCLARILSNDEAVQQRASAFLRKLADGILKVEEIALKAPPRAKIHKLMQDLGTVEWIMTREIFVQGLKANWDPKDPELKKMAISMAAGPTTTKYAMENVLSTVKDCGDRIQKNKEHMGLFSKWLYAATSRHSTAGGVTQLKVDKQDFVDLQHLYKEKEFTKKKVWEDGLKTFKEIVPRPDKIVPEIRKAGYHSNKISAAAAMYVINDAGRDFANLSKAWAGQRVEKYCRVHVFK